MGFTVLAHLVDGNEKDYKRFSLARRDLCDDSCFSLHQDLGCYQDLIRINSELVVLEPIILDLFCDFHDRRKHLFQGVVVRHLCINELLDLNFVNADIDLLHGPCFEFFIQLSQRH